MVAVNAMHAMAFRTTVDGLTGHGVFEIFPPNPEPAVAEFMANIRASFERVLATGRAEEARTLLMNEVDHRARNALTVVQSIVRLTEADDLATFKAVTMGRVDALARAQTSLSHRRWEGGDLHEVIAQEVAALSLEDRVTLAGPPILLSAEQVQDMSMLLHELATNACKYGALSAPAGTVAVDWTAPMAATLRITWMERGGPPPAPPQRIGFGHRLIQRMAQQLRGQVRHDWEPEGLVVTLDVAI